MMNLLRFLARAPYALCVTAIVPILAVFAWGLKAADDPGSVWGDIVVPLLRAVWLGEESP